MQSGDLTTDPVSKKAAKVAVRIEEMRSFIRESSSSFSEEVIVLTKRRGYNKATFCTKTLLSEKTYSRIWRGNMRSIVFVNRKRVHYRWSKNGPLIVLTIVLFP